MRFDAHGAVLGPPQHHTWNALMDAIGRDQGEATGTDIGHSRNSTRRASDCLRNRDVIQTRLVRRVSGGRAVWGMV